MSADGAGGGSRSWSTLASVWGRLIQARGREDSQRGVMEASVDADLWIRSSALMASLTTADRVVVAGETYNILAITQPDRRSRELYLQLRRGVAT